MVFSKLREKIREKLRPKNVYAHIGDTETYRKLVNKGLSYENAQLLKENLLLKKELKEKDQYISYLLQRFEGKQMEEAYQQEKLMEQIKKSREFKFELKPQKPIVLISAYSYEPFRDARGVEYPYWTGFKLCHSPESALPYFVFLLSRKPDKKPQMALNTQPRIWFPFSIPRLFRDVRTLFYTLKHGGRLEVLITPDGLFTGPKIEVEISEGEDVKKHKKVKKLGRKKKHK